MKFSPSIRKLDRIRVDFMLRDAGVLTEQEQAAALAPLIVRHLRSYGIYYDDDQTFQPIANSLDWRAAVFIRFTAPLGQRIHDDINRADGRLQCAAYHIIHEDKLDVHGRESWSVYEQRIEG